MMDPVGNFIFRLRKEKWRVLLFLSVPVFVGGVAVPTLVSSRSHVLTVLGLFLSLGCALWVLTEGWALWRRFKPCFIKNGEDQ